jgi:hypothetical protein
MAIITTGRFLKRHQPRRLHPHALRVVEPAQQTLKVTTAISVGIHIRNQRQAGNNGVLIPKNNHVGGLSGA